MMVKSWIKCFSANLAITKCTYALQYEEKFEQALFGCSGLSLSSNQSLQPAKVSQKILLASKVIKSDLIMINSISQSNDTIRAQSYKIFKRLFRCLTQSN